MLSFSFVMSAMFATNGRYIGTLPPFGAINEKMTSSAVTGVPSCHRIPGLSVTSIVVGFSHL